MIDDLKFYYRKLINKYSKYPIVYNNGFNLQKILTHFKINIVFDVGAYTGTYAMSLRRFGYRGKIISFEPIRKSHDVLLRNSTVDKNWIVYSKIGLGDKKCLKDIYISKKADSSSFLKIKKEHLRLEPDSKVINKEKVFVDKFDNVIRKNKYINLSKSILKIDTQGYEYEILKGSKKEKKKIKLVQVELSLVELYKGQKNLEKILEFLKKKKFQIWSIVPGFKNKRNGRLLQYDIIMFRDD